MTWNLPEILGCLACSVRLKPPVNPEPCLKCVNCRQGKQPPEILPQPKPSCSSQELFCVCGALKRARLVHPGVAEVVFVKKDDAITAYKKYNNRCLDGKSEKAASSPRCSSLLTAGLRGKPSSGMSRWASAQCSKLSRASCVQRISSDVLFLIEVWLVYNVVLVSDVQHSDSVV